MKPIFTFLLLVPVVFLLSCNTDEECADCNLNPKVKVKFQALASLAHVDSLFTEVKSKITAEKKKLEGEELTDEERNAITQGLVVLRNDSSMLGEQYALFRSGSARMDFVAAKGAKSMDFFQDTLVNNFAVPVDMQHDTSTFYFGFHGFEDTLQLFYGRQIIQTLDGVRMRLNGIGVNREMSTFDSVRVQCLKSGCSNDQTTIFLYF